MLNSDGYDICRKIIPTSYVQQAVEAKNSVHRSINQLLDEKRIPETGFSDSAINSLLSDFADMDSNNFTANCGAGEREGRIFSPIVADRHFRLCHGIGRSGELTAIQPKAAGSSIIAKLTNGMALHALKLAGAVHVADCLVVPVATGMCLCHTFLALRQQRPLAKYIIWPRVDQKSCFKSMITAGFIPVIVENQIVGDELQTDMEAVRDQINLYGPENILCLHTTTSCFAPRAPDQLPALAILCKDFDIPHVVNNACGTQSSKCMHLIEEAARVGRLDAFIQSLDKNYLIPVGGSVIAGYDKAFLTLFSHLYPGRASSVPSVDLFITFLSMGTTGYKTLLAVRKEIFGYLKDQLQKFAGTVRERVLETPNNTVSLGITLSSLDEQKCTMLGSMLFHRAVSGARVIPRGARLTIEGHEFIGFGSHTNHPDCAYLTVAAAIGMRKDEVDVLITRLSKAFSKISQTK